MPFNSLLFLFAVLPLALSFDALAQGVRPQSRHALLVALSFAFYGWWDLRLLPLLIASVVINWLAGAIFAKTHGRLIIPLAIGANLLVLGTFKYVNFFADLLAVIPGYAPPHFSIALPLGISFFTFQHIMYLADLRAGRAEPVGLLEYALYVAFFPRVIAGPLVRPNEFRTQLDQLRQPALESAERMARGLMLLTLGLAKKVLVADPLGAIVNPIYAAVEGGTEPTVAQAWEATLGYTFQLYFDFSGYTDMAVGIALLFGVVLPENFNAPYRAYSIQDFWRRWHMTLSRFLRDYLYIPMGGSRHGLTRQVLALLATMTLGGLWHGAGLTFVAWGVAHGLALGADLLWRKSGRSMPTYLGVTLTFAFVALAWVLFRAPSFGTALQIYKALFGFAALGELAPAFWPMLTLAAVLAVLGPTARELAERLPAVRWIGVAATLVFVAVLLSIGDDTNTAFIYAQF
jgi:D-alanyl-lipoteichoic acid acyltransferase DltB (MBOAT superfamily)